MPRQRREINAALIPAAMTDVPATVRIADDFGRVPVETTDDVARAPMERIAAAENFGVGVVPRDLVVAHRQEQIEVFAALNDKR